MKMRNNLSLKSTIQARKHVIKILTHFQIELQLIHAKVNRYLLITDTVRQHVEFFTSLKASLRAPVMCRLTALTRLIKLQLGHRCNTSPPVRVSHL